MAPAFSNSDTPFFQSVDIGKTALLLSDIQNAILKRFPDKREGYLAAVNRMLQAFREEIDRRKALNVDKSPGEKLEIPLIVHCIVPFGINYGTSMISPNNKTAATFLWNLAKARHLDTSGGSQSPYRSFGDVTLDIPTAITPTNGWSSDEFVVTHIRPSILAGSDLDAYLHGRGIKHVVMGGLTTSGTVLGSARQAADQDIHVILPKDLSTDDELDVHDFLMDRVLGRQCDVVDIDQVVALIKGAVPAS
ncbi:hypothetical protein FRB93_002216 [Tulasnella sp. JGI-2019a]|nr:hypothetical protein FRB93_002216 [Tulasnella sp. JGI-2019a]